MKESVYLIGCRAVGKSSIGKALAKKLSYAYLDTDTMITDSQGKNVAEIVAANGWSHFREKEKEVLMQLIHRDHCVVATGGGAIVHTELWPPLKEQGIVVWLRAELDTLCKRIQKDTQTDTLRPSLTGGDICQELEEVLKERSQLYAAAADFTIDTGLMDVDEAVAEIESNLTHI